MDNDSEKKELTDIAKFIRTLGITLIEETAPEMRPQFRRVWGKEPAELSPQLAESDPIAPRVLRFINEAANPGNVWKQLIDHGLTGEPLRLKHDFIEASAAHGWIKKCLRVVISVIDSIAEGPLAYLKPVKEFFEFLEQAVDHLSEPWEKLRTLFPT